MLAAMRRASSPVSSLAAASAYARPHVWVTMTEELLYAPDGSVTGRAPCLDLRRYVLCFRHAGLEQKTKATCTRKELAPLAKVNIE